MENKQVRERMEKELVEENGLVFKKPKSGKKGNKMKPKIYPVPPEDSFVPLQEDSEEIKYNTGNNVS